MSEMSENKRKTLERREHESAVREKICEVCASMWRFGWIASNDGNVTVKLEDDRFLATPAGIRKNALHPDELLKMNLAGEILYSKLGFKPSSEIKMHLRCYRERSDINAVIHAHSPAAAAFAVANKPLDDDSLVEAVLTIGKAPVAPYAMPSTEAVGDSVAPLLKDHDVILLQNHGAITVGVDLITAFNRMETLELWAKTIINAQALGGAKAIPKDEIDKLVAKRKQFGITGKNPYVGS